MKSIANIYKNTFVVILTAFIFSCVTTPKYASLAERPSNWAIPIVSEHLENCFKISEKLIRCAQPTKQGFTALEAMNVKTVINLRQFHSDESKLEHTTLKLIDMPLATLNVSDSQIKEILSEIENSDGPVVIHCWHGADRTGTVSAAYRISKQKWTNAQALEEMLYGSYGYHSMFSNLEDLVNGFK